MASELISFFSQFRAIPKPDADLISAAFERRRYRENDVLFEAGTACDEIFFVCDGILRVAAGQENGNEVTYFFIGENRFCTILNSFNNRVIAQESILAACGSEVLAISRTSLDALYDGIDYLKPLMDRITQQSLLDKIAVRNSYLGQDSTARYKLFTTRQPEIAKRVSLTHIASYLCVTPQSLSRIRKNIR